MFLSCSEVTVANGSVPVWQNNMVSVSGGPSASGNVFVPKTPENFTYDADGNETADGHWSLGWDGENRVTWIGGATTLPAGSALGMNCAYDWRSRRISKTVSNYTAGAWSRTAVSNFVYDGWNLIAILDGLNANNLLYSFQWGTDLSGTMQGAGGVGGLISMRVHSGANAGIYFYCYDGNGNVTALVNATTGAIAAQYEYDPFGNLIRSTGPMALLNPFRFSTKYQDDETGFSYYGYRYYNASTGRWLSRDPVEELGGLNLCGFVYNSPMGFIDLLGLREDVPPGESWHPKQDALAQQFFNETLRGAEWRIAFVLEYGGKYRELYVQEAAEFKNLRGQIPKSQLDALRNALKDKYQKITPPEVEQALRAAVGANYVKRGPTGNFNPEKTNELINKTGKVCKHFGRVLVVVMVYSEYQKISNANDWQRQLGSSGSGVLGAIVGGSAGGAAVGAGLGALELNPITIAVGTLLGGGVGAVIGYELFSGAYEQLWDIIYEKAQ